MYIYMYVCNTHTHISTTIYLQYLNIIYLFSPNNINNNNKSNQSYNNSSNNNNMIITNYN